MQSEPQPRCDVQVLRTRYLTAQLSGDRREALRLIIDEGLHCGASVQELQRRVIHEAQRETGVLWQENRISIAEEHMATAISNQALAHLFRHAASSPSNGRKVVVACVEGELHDFPARPVADALLSAPEKEKPDLLALSVTMSFNAAALRTTVARVRAATQGRLPIAVSGHACQWAQDLPREVEADGSECDAAQMVQTARRLVGVDG